MLVKQQIDQSLLGHLSTFHLVAQLSSFSLAAKALRLPRSSVSRSVATLESALSVSLLHRTTRKVALSPAGRLLFDRTASGLESLTSALSAPLGNSDDETGVVRVTAVADFTVAVLADAVAAFVLRWPHIRVDLVLTDDIVDLRGDGIDVAFRFSFGRLKGDGLVARKLGSVSLGLHASPGYLARVGTPRKLDDLARHSFVSMSSLNRVRLSREDQKVLVGQAAVIRCNEMGACKALVLAGAGLGFLPSHLVKDDVKRGALVPVLSDWRSANGTAWLVLTRKDVPRRVQLFRDFIVAAAADWFS